MVLEDAGRYVVRHPKNGIYRYIRRVPTEVARFVKHQQVNQSLKTKNLAEALEKAKVVHEASESLWRSLLAETDSDKAFARWEAAVRIVQSLGFTYKPATEAATMPLAEIEARAAVIQENLDRQQLHVVEAVAGLVDKPSPRLSNLWQLYEEHNAAGLTGMSPDQMRKHKVSRQRAIRYAQDMLGDAELAAISRSDVLRFRNWWTEKIAAENLKAYSANRCFSDIMGMLTVVDNALHSNFHAVWEKSRVKETNATKLEKRLPFPVDYVRDRIMAKGALDALNEDARFILYTMIETGLRLGEVCNLRPQDIRLDDEVPHVEVAERTDRRQKTEHSIRRVPLVGISLWAMKQRPEGFPRYQDSSDSASAIINKVMASQKLRPTKKHTAYSIRHTFQDRIENAGCSDRMQADLMGHEFGRPRYGDGAEMKRRQAFLEALKIPCAWIE